MQGREIYTIKWKAMFVHLVDKTSRECEVVLSARTSLGKTTLSGYNVVKTPPILKGSVQKCCIRSAILHVSKIRCQKQNKMQIMRIERSAVKAIFGIQHKDMENLRNC